MLKQGIATGFCLALMSGFSPAQAACSKPADLPSHNQIECPDCGDEPKPRKFSLELDISSKGITLKLESGLAQPEPAPAIDAFTPAFVEHWLQHAADALTQPQRSMTFENLLGRVPYVRSFSAATLRTDEPPMAAPAVVKDMKKPAVDVEKHLRQLFESASEYRRRGLPDAARYLYQRVHLLSPTSSLGRLAIEHLQEIETRLRDAGEEQSHPDRRDEPETRRDIRNGTMPLGLVRLVY